MIALLSCPVAASFAEDGVNVAKTTGTPASFWSFLTAAPPEARHVAPALQQVFKTYTASVAARQDMRQLRAEQDSMKGKLATVSGELKIQGEHRQQLEQELAALEREQQERLASLRQELEARLEAEIAQTRQQILDELQQEFTRQVQTFETRQRGAVDKALEQDLDLKEHELQQLSREIELQTQDLLDRLARLDTGPELASSLEQSMTEVLARRKAELEARRQALHAEREAYVTRARAQFAEELKQEQAAELSRRLTVKEATLRQSMAELLHQTRRQDTSRLQERHGTFEQVTRRSSELAQEQAALQARLEALDRDMAARLHQAESIEAERQVSLARLEQTFQKRNPGLRVGSLSWLTQAIQQAPSELATELGLLQQRLVTQVRQEQQLEEQRRVLRERQLALQLAREMESRYQQIQLAEQRERDALSRRAEDLLAKADELAQQGRYDDALRLVAQAQALNPPQLSRVMMRREELLNGKERAHREAKAAQLEQLFARAMETFQQGAYEEAVALFEQVIVQEAALEGSAPVAAEQPTPP